MFEDEQEELDKQTFIENTESDVYDLLTGRIKDPEHLQAADVFVDRLGQISEKIDSIISTSGNSVYEYINSKSIPELNKFFDTCKDFLTVLEGINVD